MSAATVDPERTPPVRSGRGAPDVPGAQSRAGGRSGVATGLLPVLLLLLLAATPAPDDPTTAPAPAEQRRADAVLLVLDASGSMNQPAPGGLSRLQSAQEAIRDFVSTVDEAIEVGLRVFGHRLPSGSPGTCTDSELLVEVGEDRAAVAQALEGIEAQGDTPIGYALQQGVADLPDRASDPVIVLVSDGLSDCTGDRPCEVAQEIIAAGVEVTIDTIGFQVDQEAERQLTCIAEATGGVYVAADDAVMLAGILQTYQPSGTWIRGGDVSAAALPITSGLYLDSLTVGESRWYAVEILDGQQVRVAATLVSPPDGPFAPDAAVFLTGFVAETIGATQCAGDTSAGVGREALQVAADLARDGAPQLCTQAGRFLVSVELRDVVDPAESVLAGVEHTVELFVSVVGEPPEESDQEAAPASAPLPPVTAGTAATSSGGSSGGPDGLVVAALSGLLGIAVGSAFARRQGL